MMAGSRISQAIASLEARPSIEIGGRKYLPVVERVKALREFAPELSLSTEVVEISHKIGGAVVVRASVKDEHGRELSSGYAEQIRGDGPFGNSPLELAETKAIGRALAGLGLAGREYASADELASVAASRGESSGKAAGAGDNRNGEPPALQAGSAIGDAGFAGLPALSGPSSLNSEPHRGWGEVVKALIVGLKLQENLPELADYYKSNTALIDEIKAKQPELHKELVQAFGERKKQLKETGDV